MPAAADGAEVPAERVRAPPPRAHAVHGAAAAAGDGGGGEAERVKRRS